MKILWQLCFIFALCFMGEIVSFFLPFPFPASIISLLILLFLLCTKLIKTEQIQETSEYLLKNMAFFFLPAGVKVMEQFAIIQSQIPVLLFIAIFTMIITFLASSLTVAAVIRVMDKHRERKGRDHAEL